MRAPSPGRRSWASRARRDAVHPAVTAFFALPRAGRGGPEHGSAATPHGIVRSEGPDRKPSGRCRRMRKRRIPSRGEVPSTRIRGPSGTYGRACARHGASHPDTGFLPPGTRGRGMIRRLPPSRVRDSSANVGARRYMVRGYGTSRVRREYLSRRTAPSTRVRDSSQAVLDAVAGGRAPSTRVRDFHRPLRVADGPATPPSRVREFPFASSHPGFQPPARNPGRAAPSRNDGALRRADAPQGAQRPPVSRIARNFRQKQPETVARLPVHR